MESAVVVALWLLFVGFSGKGTNVESQSLQNPAGFLNIDCGVASNYHDEVLRLDYQSDEGFIESGMNAEITVDTSNQTQWPMVYNNKQMQNLRYFPEGKRNCYTLRHQEGRGSTYLLRVWFYYGNYDKKNQPPVFDLHFGVNYWSTVTSSTPSFPDIIYFSRTNDVQVCLINTGGGIPFISALELRLLHNSTYHQPGIPTLIPIWRFNLGGSKDYIRYPADVYDRIWQATSIDSWGEPISNNAIGALTELNVDPYKVPAEVMSTAQKAPPDHNLTITWTSNSSRTWCVFLHFAELQRLMSDQQRVLAVQFNGEDVGPDVTLPYLTPTTVNTFRQGTSEPNLTIYSADNSSSYPPIINAVEYFMFLDDEVATTAQGDVDAINHIKKVYGLNRSNWQGDPCFPTNYIWDGLSCSYVNIPRIISLNLSFGGLSGPLDASLSSLSALESLNLSNNNLTGKVPDFSALPNLRNLDLRANNLEGSVPQSLLNRQIKKELDLRLSENPDLCLANCHQRKKIIVPVIATVSVLLALSLIAAVIIWRIRKRQREGHVETSLKLKNRPFAYREVVEMTDNFRTCIGEGGYGKVYLGTLSNGTKVAVKLLSGTSRQGYEDFQAEAQPLMIIHHRNLVSLIGYCDSTANRALIYELMEKGNLHQLLSGGPGLSWKERVRIAVDAAQGLDYLHNGCKPPIIHRDLKTPNILLDENMQAKIADFGLSKAFNKESNSHITTRPAGTFGYLDPEFHASGNLSRKSDVYSFGIILFELISGRPAVMRAQGGYVTHILQWVNPIIERGDINSVMDPRLNGEFEACSAWKLVEIAMSCVPPTAIQRPDIREVLAELRECWAMEEDSERRLNGSFETTSTKLDHYSAPAAR